MLRRLVLLCEHMQLGAVAIGHRKRLARWRLLQERDRPIGVANRFTGVASEPIQAREPAHGVAFTLKRPNSLPDPHHFAARLDGIPNQSRKIALVGSPFQLLGDHVRLHIVGVAERSRVVRRCLAMRARRARLLCGARRKLHHRCCVGGAHRVMHQPGQRRTIGIMVDQGAQYLDMLGLRACWRVRALDGSARELVTKGKPARVQAEQPTFQAFVDRRGVGPERNGDNPALQGARHNRCKLQDSAGRGCKPRYPR
jgi:hypothetical protein